MHKNVFEETGNFIATPQLNVSYKKFMARIGIYKSVPNYWT